LGNGTWYVQATANSFLGGIGFSSQAKSGKFHQQSRGLHDPNMGISAHRDLPKNNRYFCCEGEDAHGNYM
jgi:hypothetical protein